MTTPARGEVWFVNLDPSIGDEIQKQRPAVVMSRDAIGVLALRVVVPITSWQPKFQSADWLIRLDPDAGSGLTKLSAADTFQVRSLSTKRFSRRLGRLSDSDIARIARD